MKTFLNGILGVLLAGFAASAAAQEMAPDELVKNVTTEVLELIAKDKEIRSGSRTKLIQVIEAKVLPHFNFNSMTALAAGQSWGKATPDQKKRLVEEFRTLLVRTYASALAAYSEQRFDYRPLRARPTDTDVTVNVRVIQSGALEASNVDITTQLVNMITAQRNFQANAQMISTSDQITQTIINIR